MNWRSFLFGVCAFGVAFALLGGLDFFRSEETKIRRLLAAEAEAFNDCKGFSVLEHFAPEWQDETTGVTRQALKGGLLYVFQNRRDPKTQRFLYRIEVGDYDVQVQGDHATVVIPLVLHEGLDADEKSIWELRVTAELGKHDGTWRVDRSRHETIRGSAPR